MSESNKAATPEATEAEAVPTEAVETVEAGENPEQAEAGAVTETGETGTTTEGGEAGEPETPTLVQMQFKQDAREAGMAHLNTAMDFATEHGVEFYANLPVETVKDGDEEWEEYVWPENGMSLFIAGSHKKGEAMPFAIVALMIPCFAQALESTDGHKMAEQLFDIQMRKKGLNPIRNQKDGEAVGVLPSTLEDFFITAAKGGGQAALLKPWKAIAKALLGKVKPKVPVIATLDTLKLVLSNKAYAESVAPGVVQERWTGLLDTVIAHGVTAGTDVTIFQNWLDTRDSAKMDVVEDGDDDFSNLDDIF